MTAACGVLAQFGGVTLAFAFLATFGFTGFVTVWLQNAFGVDPYAAGGWLTDTPGLLLVYTYFQIPLMVIVFLPALDGLRPQWREATESLGGLTCPTGATSPAPSSLPSFLGGMLLLFANAFSAYATAAALISQGSPIVPLQIDAAISGEVLLARTTSARRWPSAWSSSSRSCCGSTPGCSSGRAHGCADLAGDAGGPPPSTRPAAAQAACGGAGAARPRSGGWS